MTSDCVPASRAFVATLVFAFGVSGSLKLKTNAEIGEVTFAFFVCLAVLASLFVAFYDRIGSLSLRDLKIEMAKVESTRKEVEQREQNVRRIALTLAEVAVFLAAFQRRFGTEETQTTEVKWLSEKVARLLDGIHAPPEERERVFWYLDAVRRIDSIREENAAESERLWDELWERIRQDIAKERS